MDGCTNVFNLDNASALKDLQKDYGSNIDGFSSALTKLVNNVKDGGFEPTKEFSNYVKTHYNKDKINFNSKEEYIRKAIKDFIAKDNFDVNSTSIQRENANPNAKFYTDAATRNFGKKLAIGIFNDVYSQYQFDKAVRDRAQASIDKAKKAGKATPTLNDRAFYTRIVASAFRNELFDRIAAKEGKKTDELLKDPAFIKSIIKGNKFDFDAIYDKLGGDNATTQDKNVYAIFREMHGAHRKEYFDEMFRDGRLNYLKLKESDDDKEIDAQEDAEENGRISDIDGKAMAEAWSDKDTPSFVSSIDSDLRVWFGSIKRLNSTNTVGDKLDFDTNNNFGIPDRLDASETVNTLIHLLIGVNNTQEAINRINTAASTLAGHASYKVIADKMKKNSDLANRVMRNLSKMVGSKSMIVVRDGKVAAQISNSRSNNVDALFSDFVNSSRKAVVTNIDVAPFKNRIKVITDNLVTKGTKASDAFAFILKASSTDEIIDAKEDKEKGTYITSAQQRFDMFLKAFHEYFPTVPNEAIIGYIKHNKPTNPKAYNDEPDEFANLRNLSSLLKEVAEQGDLSRQDRDEYYRKADLARDKNWQLEKKYGKAAAYRDDYIDEDAIRYQDYLNNHIYKTISDVANAMKDYMVTDIATTSLNALRKQSSDVLDNNRVTEVMRITRSYATLKPYGEIIENIATSPYSNILIEHKDANGNTENYGLFKEDPETGKLVPTDYASDLISTSVFNGINDNDNGNNTIYNKMLTADYIASAFNMFFKPATTRRQKDSAITYASYFMRTPSDKPGNDVITAPKYAYGFGDDALYVDANKTGTNSKVQAEIDEVAKYDNALLDDNILAYNPMASVPENVLNLSSAQVARLLLGKSIDKVKIDNKTLRTNIISKAKKNNGTARFIVSDAEKEGKKTVLVVEAKVKDGKITDITSKGLISEGNLDFPDTKLTITSQDIKEAAKAKLDEQIRRDMLNKGQITTKINTNHPIFKAYKRAFMGEVMEAANALDKFFETNSDGSVVIYPSGTHKGELVAKGASWVDENGVRQYDYSKGLDLTNPLAHHGYEVYHSDNGVVYDGHELKGKVFTSNKFTVGTTNFGNELMQKLINPLYRGADDTDKDIHLKINRNIDGHATGYGKLTAEQETAINDMISNYIKALSDDAVTRFNDYKQFINNDVVPTKENIIEFITNNNLMEYNFDELYEGNSKFYKSAQDFLKRAKEAQAGGDPYGMADFSVPDALATMTTIRHLDGLTKVDANGKKSKYDVELRNKFRAVTIYNSVRTDKKTEQRLIDAAVKNNPQGEASRARITDIIEKAHNDLKANDAQSFITYDEWIRRIAGRGQLEQYKDLINAINDESKPVNAKAIGQFVQVQKNFYYDQYYDKAMGIMIPRQIKNAEFVLIPRFIKGTELEQVYDLMKNNNIDQLNTRETSKAGKHNVLRLWDDFGNLDSKAIEQFGSNASSLAEEYDYRHLYTQQETVQHINSDNKVAVQSVKKIVDNISDGPLKDVKDDFFRTYSTKIYRSFRKLIDELHIPLDDNGHLKLDANGDIAGIDADMLLEKLQNEALRNGMDSNLIDYFTKKPDTAAKELGIEGFKGVDTLMPMYLSNMSNKTQSVVNALFNSSITRQKLNGFHAAQVTNIGFKAYKKDIEKSKELKYLRYHENPDGSYAAHMEIAMTYSAFGIDVNNKHYTALREEARKEAEAELANGNITSSAISAFAKKYSVATSKKTKANVADQESAIAARTKEIFDQKIIKELEEDGLDKVVSYRIPTEGKQSMAIAKIAHFLDDTYGSTIVVPDEWVAQTGSDFDIDSVYGIQHRSYVDRDGRVRKYNWIDDPTEFDYFHYVNRELKRLGQDKYNVNIHADVEKALKDLDNLNDKEYKELQNAETEAYKALPDDLKKEIKEADSSFVEDKTLSKRDNYINRLNAYIKGMAKYIGDKYINTEKGKSASKFIDTVADIVDYLEDNASRKDKRSEAINKLVEERRQKFEDAAKKNNLKSYDEYVNTDAFERNSDNALDNKMVDDMLKILSDPSSTEENLSASTFAQITEANRKIEEFGNTKEASNERKARSPYNFLDQASYMNDVMSGARLKAFSVTRDTFCSVCNTVRPILNDKFAINIKYPDGKVKKHQQHGWATDDDGKITNRNVDGYLITTYSSQTSAHAFDAVKEGSIPNVNEYTFAAYKLFPEIGSNYLAAISFIRQPGITKIVDAYNRNTSVFNDINRNPIHDAIRSVAKDLGIHDVPVGKESIDVDKVPINTLVSYIDNYREDFRKIFPNTPDKPISIDDINYMKDVPLDVKTQIARCQGKHNDKLSKDEVTRREALYDLGTILEFQRLNTIAQKITDLARVCNPDKFGAKQTIYSTNKVFDDIQTIIKNEQDSEPTLIVEREDKELDDIKVQAIKYGTFMKAPNGKPTNLSERQWLQTRTKEFKNWFGDWERVANSSRFNKRDHVSNSITSATYQGVSVSDVKFDPDMAPDGGTRIIFLGDKYIGEIPVVESKDRIRMSGSIGTATEIEEEYRGKGYGKKAHLALANIAKSEGKTLYSDSSNSDAEDALWKSLVKDGIAEVVSESPKDEHWNHTTYRIINDKLPQADDINSGDRGVSKVVDENGEPLVVYHGSKNGDFDTFDYNNLRTADSGFFFTTDKKYAAQFGNTRGFFLNIKNPNVTDTPLNIDSVESLLTTDYKRGTDGIQGHDDINTNENLNKSRGQEYVAMRPSQIKLATDNDTKMSFLDAVYPNVGDGLDKYITSTPTHKSLYSTLDSFLRYATASSIKAARPLFKTQNKVFRDLCDGLSSVLDARGKSRIDEDTYNDFEKYVLGDIYNNVPGLTLPVTVNVKGNDVTFDIKHDDNVSAEDARTNEINRIYGYGHGPTFEVTSTRTDEEGHTIEYRKDFTVENMNAPTDKEVSEFEQLTPAQKVQFIKDHSIGDNIFMHLNVNLDTSNRRYRRGQQTIELIQDTADNESLYELFDAAINNKNPLVASAAMDLIKYSFVVEGFKMSRNAINGIIKNTALYGDTFGKDNKSIVDDIDSKVSTADHIESDVANRLYEDYVRSHPNMRGIAKTVNYKIKDKGYEFQPFTDKPRFGLIQIKNPINGSNKNDGTNFLESHNIITFKTVTDINGKKQSVPVLNKYVRMRKQGTKDFQLYKAEFDNNGDYIYLIPLNPLEANEHGTFSANPKYHTFASVDYYENLIKGDINKPTINIEDYMAKEIPSKFKGTVRDFDLNKPKDGEVSQFETIANNIANDSNFINNDSATKYIYAPVLHDYFKYASFGQSSHQVINLTDKDGTTISKDVAISRLLTPRQVYTYRNNYLKHGATVDTKHNKVSQEEADAINAGLRDGASIERLESIYKVEHVSVNPSDGLRMSSVSEDTTPPVEKELQDTDADKVVNKTPSSALLQHRIEKANQAAVKAIMLSDDPVATAIKDDMRKHNINQGISSVKANSTLIAYAGYRFATEKRNRILNNLGYSVNNFAQFEGHWVNIKHDKVRELIRTNDKVRRDFLTLLAEAKQFCKDFADFDYLDISSIDSQEKFYYDEIKKTVNEIRNNSVLEDARVMFENDYLDRMSTDPLIQEGLLSVKDGYHGSSFLEAQIGDLQSAPNPMVQITTKLIMDDIQSKDKAGRDELAKINKEIAKIINDAKAKGESCSWNDVIDEYGILKQDYNRTYFDDYRALDDAMVDAKIKHGDNSIEYLKARLAKRRWMAKNVQQEVTYDNTTFDGDPFADPDNRSYYDRLNDLEENIITKAPEIYSEYNKRVATRNGLYSKRVPGIINDALEKQIDAAEKAVQRLVSDFTVDAYGEVVSKTEYDEEHPYSNDAAKRTQQKINSLNNARILKKYLEDKRDLQSNVYEDETRSGWADDLKRNQAIIDKYEDRTDSGELKVNRSSLAMQYPDYARALEWMHNNARKEVALTGDIADWYLNEEWRLDEAAKEGKTKEYLIEHYALNTPLVVNDGRGLDSESVDREIKTSKPLAIHHEANVSSLSQELNAAFKLIRGKKQDREFYKTILNKHEGIINRYGEVDATLLTDDEIAKIKKQQEINNNIRGNAVGSDRTIINNAGKNPIIYNRAFYDGLSVTHGRDNAKHLELVNKFNELVRPYWDRHNNRLCTYLMPVEVLHKMKSLLDELSEVKSKNGVPKGEVERIIAFRDKNVQVVTNEKEYEYQKNEALKKGPEYYNEWLSANAEFDLNGTGDLKPVERLYSYLKPKEEVMSKFIDFKRTRAFKLLDDMYETVNTDAYDRKFNEMKAKGDKAFNKWYLDNTIYNPYTHSREPLMCWRKSQLKSGVASTWVPTANNTKRVIAEEFRNKNFHAGGEGLMLGKNFNRETAEDKYKSAQPLNDSQRVLRDYIQNKLDYYTRTRREDGSMTKAQRYTLNGQMPMEYSEEALKSMGSKGNRALDAAKEATDGIRSFLGLNGAREINNDQSPIDWHTPLYDMPMTTLLKTKNSVTKKFVKPNRTDFEEGEAGDTKYNEAVQQYRKDTQAARQKNLEENAKVMNKDWEKVFQDFVTKAIHYNAIQDNRALAHYTRDALERANIYDQNSATTRFKRDGKASTPDSPQYVKVNDENLKQQFDVWYRRLFCDQWREPTSAKLNRIASYLQNFTSSTYMMMNIRGGISNITTGFANIAGESFAADYFGHRNWINGTGRYYSGLTDYLKNMFTNKSDTLEGGLIKYFHIVELDRLNNLETNDETKGVVEHLRDFAYTPQSAGEHRMQNGALFTMMDSHRLVLDPNASKTGSPKYRIVNEAEYVRDAHNEALRQILNDEQYAKFIEFQEKVKNDPQLMKRYAWYRGNFVTNFLRNVVSDNAEERHKIQKEFIKAKDKIKQDKIKEFEKAPKVIDQFELGDDREIHFKKDSILNEIDVVREGESVSDAYKLIGSFTNRVISVNKKIHGWYDRLAAAQIEKHVWGSIVMQYHKHIYPGLMKHWRRRGYYNESRGTIEKGCYTALKDFITLPLDDARIRARIKDEDMDSWKGLQNFVRSSFDYLRNLKTVWQLLPDYERNNVRRNLGDIGSIASAFFTIFALRMIQDNKDKDSIAFNLCLYEADRLASESSQFNPIGLVTQGKTLWSKPVAAESIITDLTKTLGELSAMAIEGDDYDGYYHSGIHHGESKIGVYVKRRIPIYRQYYSMSTLPKNNKSYRIGDNTLTFLGINPKGIAEDIRGKKLDD